MKHTQHYIFFFLSCVFMLSLFSFPVSAEQVDTFPDYVTDVQKEWIYGYLYNSPAYSDLVVFFNKNNQYAFIGFSVTDLDFESGSMVISEIVSMSPSGTKTTNYSSINISDFRSATTYRQFLYLRDDSNYYFGPVYNAAFTNKFMVNMSQHISNVNHVYDREYYIQDFEISLPEIIYNFSGDMTCRSEVNGTCSIYASDSGGTSGSISEPLVMTSESTDILVDVSNGNFTTNTFNYTVTTVFEILFDDYYTGYLVGNFDGYTTDNALIVYDYLYFTDTAKITLEYVQYFKESAIKFPQSEFFVKDYNFQKSVGRPVYDPTSNQLLESGNSISQSASSSLNSTTSDLNDVASDFESFEAQFNSDLTSSLNRIDVNQVDFGNNADFSRTALWVKLRFDELVDSSGIFGQVLTFSLIIGLFMLLVGRGDKE